MMRVPFWPHYFRRDTDVLGCTLVVVPDGIDAPLTMRFSGRAVRALSGVLVAVATLLGVAVLSIGLDLTGHSPFAAAGVRRQTRVLSSLRAQVVILRDTVARLAAREAEIRTLAGLETVDSLMAVDSTSTAMPAGDIDALIERASTLATRFAEASAALHCDVDRAARTPSIMPTTGWLSSQFS